MPDYRTWTLSLVSLLTVFLIGCGSSSDQPAGEAEPSSDQPAAEAAPSSLTANGTSLLILSLKRWHANFQNSALQPGHSSP
jgi:hypothetical protein